MALRQQPMMCQQCTFHVLLLLLVLGAAAAAAAAGPFGAMLWQQQCAAPATHDVPVMHLQRAAAAGAWCCCSWTMLAQCYGSTKALASNP
jgi:hypothetical protein